MAHSLKENRRKEDKIKYSNFPLTRINFVLMLGGSNQLDHFNADIFSSRRIVVGPTIAFLGFVGMAFAIIFKKK